VSRRYSTPLVAMGALQFDFGAAHVGLQHLGIGRDHLVRSLGDHLAALQHADRVGDGDAVELGFIRFADRKRENRGIQYFIQPGLWLQRLTAREPTEDQIEVALCALQAVLELEGRK